MKRRLKEVLRREILPRLDRSGVALDLMVRARPEAFDTSYATFAAELVGWADARWPGSS